MQSTSRDSGTTEPGRAVTVAESKGLDPIQSQSEGKSETGAARTFVLRTQGGGLAMRTLKLLALAVGALAVAWMLSSCGSSSMSASASQEVLPHPEAEF